VSGSPAAAVGAAYPPRDRLRPAQPIAQFRESVRSVRLRGSALGCRSLMQVKD
jgi:hypothetical protein